MKVNIVMLVKDRPQLTLQAVRTLRRNTPSELFNLTITDDGSRHHKEWSEWETPPNECSLEIGYPGCGITGQARNLGIYWAEKYWGRGDYLYLTDNDMYFTPLWLETLTDTYRDIRPEFKVIGGWNHPFLQPHTKAEWRNRDVIFCTHDAVAGASQLMRWETWDKYGPLDAHAKGVGQSEDWKFCQDIIKGGGRVGSIYPRVVFNCGVTNSYGQPSPGADIMTRELIKAKKHYPDLYWE